MSVSIRPYQDFLTQKNELKAHGLVIAEQLNKWIVQLEQYQSAHDSINESIIMLRHGMENVLDIFHQLSTPKKISLSLFRNALDRIYAFSSTVFNLEMELINQTISWNNLQHAYDVLMATLEKYKHSASLSLVVDTSRLELERTRLNVECATIDANLLDKEIELKDKNEQIEQASAEIEQLEAQKIVLTDRLNTLINKQDEFERSSDLAILKSLVIGEEQINILKDENQILAAENNALMDKVNSLLSSRPLDGEDIKNVCTTLANMSDLVNKMQKLALTYKFSSSKSYEVRPKLPDNIPLETKQKIKSVYKNGIDTNHALYNLELFLSKLNLQQPLDTYLDKIPSEFRLDSVLHNVDNLSQSSNILVLVLAVSLVLAIFGGILFYRNNNKSLTDRRYKKILA